MNESMSIKISAPMKQDFIIKLLDGVTLDGVTFKLVSKKGINLVFDYDKGSQEDAIRIAKQTIKSTEIGHILYFQIQ